MILVRAEWDVRVRRVGIAGLRFPEYNRDT